MTNNNNDNNSDNSNNSNSNNSNNNDGISNDINKQKKVNEFINGDDICISCTGISYISEEMRLNGQRPICFGKKTIMSKKISPQHYERLKSAEKKLEKPHVQICIGYLQTYGRRDRLGLPPIFINGIEYNYQKNTKMIKNKSNNNNNNSNDINISDKDTNSIVEIASKNDKRPDLPYQAALPLLFNTLKPTEEKFNIVKENSKWTYDTIKKGATSQYKFLQKFYEKNTVNLSSRMYKSAVEIFNNSGKTVERLEKAVNRMWPWK